jgi:hypothetical protein
MFLSLARRGYVVVSQDCRGTGDSEPATWDHYVYEREDSFDLIEWITQQPWYNGFIASCGGSYVAQTQWCMALHPGMSTIVPQVGGLGVAFRTVRKHLFYDAYARSVGKGAGKVQRHYTEMERPMLAETLASGFFNDPLTTKPSQALLDAYPELRGLSPADAKERLWALYCASNGTQRAAMIRRALGVEHITLLTIDELQGVFGHAIGRGHDAHIFPHERPEGLCKAIAAPALIITGWYDWSLDDPLATWVMLRKEARDAVRLGSRLIITPAAHITPGYHEGREGHPELERNYATPTIVDLLLRWYASVREKTTDSWPTVIYYLMGANEWRVAHDWPPPDAKQVSLFLGAQGALLLQPPTATCAPDRYTYDPCDATPTVGGSIVSYVYPPGSVDVSKVQSRSDVVMYTTPAVDRDVDVVGPLQLVLYASSSAVDTDFSARLSDLGPDGRAIQVQSGIVRARYRNGNPELLEPGRIYRFDIDMWATAYRFKAGHCLRLDISSADFPRFNRNANLGGEPGVACQADQALYHDCEHPSHLTISILRERSVPLWSDRSTSTPTSKE